GLLHQIPSQIDIIWIGIVKPDQIVHIIAVHTDKQDGQVKSTVGKSIGQAVGSFWPGIADVSFILFIDNAVAVQILKFDVTYPNVVFTDRKAIAIVVSRYRAVLGIFHR